MISSLLLRVGAALLVVGLCGGIAMGIAHDFTLAVAHAHLNLVGFVLPFAAGLYYRAVPAAGAGRLAKLQAWLAVIGGVLFPLGIGLVTEAGERYEPWVVAGSLVVLAAWVLFALIVFRSAGVRAA
jgi:hypothetical protein